MLTTPAEAILGRFSSFSAVPRSMGQHVTHTISGQTHSTTAAKLLFMSWDSDGRTTHESSALTEENA
jgi:hypothetical protein